MKKGDKIKISIPDGFMDIYLKHSQGLTWAELKQAEDEFPAYDGKEFVIENDFEDGTFALDGFALWLPAEFLKGVE